VNRVIAVILALVAAVHVSAPGIPAPAPVLLAFAVIGGLCWLIWEAAFRTVPVGYRRAGP
jgi:hypothetical protein